MARRLAEPKDWGENKDWTEYKSHRARRWPNFFQTAGLFEMCGSKLSETELSSNTKKFSRELTTRASRSNVLHVVNRPIGPNLQLKNIPSQIVCQLLAIPTSLRAQTIHKTIHTLRHTFGLPPSIIRCVTYSTQIREEDSSLEEPGGLRTVKTQVAAVA